MAGWSIFVSDGVETIVTSLAKAMPDRIRRRTTGCSEIRWCSSASSRIGSVASWCRHRGGGWGGRPFEDGGVGHGFGLSGRRAQRLDSRHRDEMPGAGEEPARCGAIPRVQGNSAAAWASTSRCATSSDGKWDYFERAKPPGMSPRGELGEANRETAAIYLRIRAGASIG